MVNEYLNAPEKEAQATNVISLEQKVQEMQQTLEKHSQIINQYQQCLGELSAWERKTKLSGGTHQKLLKLLKEKPADDSVG